MIGETSKWIIRVIVILDGRLLRYNLLLLVLITKCAKAIALTSILATFDAVCVSQLAEVLPVGLSFRLAISVGGLDFLEAAKGHKLRSFDGSLLDL